MNPDDKRRAATLLLAVLDDDLEGTTRVLDEAHRAAGGLQGLIAALAAGTLELLLGTAGEDAARKTLELTLLDASLNGEPT